MERGPRDTKALLSNDVKPSIRIGDSFWSVVSDILRAAFRFRLESNRETAWNTIGETARHLRAVNTESQTAAWWQSHLVDDCWYVRFAECSWGAMQSATLQQPVASTCSRREESFRSRCKLIHNLFICGNLSCIWVTKCTATDGTPITMCYFTIVMQLECSSCTYTLRAKAGFMWDTTVYLNSCTDPVHHLAEIHINVSKLICYPANSIVILHD